MKWQRFKWAVQDWAECEGLIVVPLASFTLLGFWIIFLVDVCGR